MRTIKRCFINSMAFLAIIITSQLVSADVLRLDSKNLCWLMINDSIVKNTIIYGTKENMLPIMKKAVWIHAHSCEYFFASLTYPINYTITSETIKKLIEKNIPDVVLNKLEVFLNKTFSSEDAFVKALSETLSNSELSQYSSIIIELSSHRSVSAAEYALERHTSNVPKSHKIYNIAQNTIVIEVEDGSDFSKIINKALDSEKECKPIGQICISTDGNAEFSVSCGPINIKISTSNLLTLGIEGKKGSGSINLLSKE